MHSSAHFTLLMLVLCALYVCLSELAYGCAAGPPGALYSVYTGAHHTHSLLEVFLGMWDMRTNQLLTGTSDKVHKSTLLSAINIFWLGSTYL